MRANVYVDGFNLYYGSLRGTAHKWLDLATLCKLLLPHDTISKIKYFSARVTARSADPDQPIRQQTYFRALQTISNLEIILGTFLSHEISMPLASPRPSGPSSVRVIKTEEKGSDVNIAAHMINDGHKGDYDLAVLITNDSDLLEPVKIVRKELGLTVGILNPQRDTKFWSRQLQRHADFMRPIRVGPLSASQFPTQLTDHRGIFHKPLTW